MQAPTKYETVIDLKTAGAVGRPPAVLVRADETNEYCCHLCTCSRWPVATNFS